MVWESAAQGDSGTRDGLDLDPSTIQGRLSMQAIDFWYSIGSTYSYLTVMRLPDCAKEHDVVFNWRPFDVRSLMIEQKNIPFANKPEKSAYMWRDIERRAAKYGLEATLPAPYPLKELVLANQVALLGCREGWGQVFTRESYRIWFVDGHPAGSEPNLSEALRRAGQDPVPAIERARASDIETALVQETAQCRDLGVFGAPSFVVDDEVFWGDDRLDDAVSWRKFGLLRTG